MAFVEITEAQIEALGIKVGGAGKDNVTVAQAELYEGWAIPQVDADFPSTLNANKRSYVLALLICHYAEIKQRIPKNETTEEGYQRAKAGNLGESQYLQNYKEEMASNSSGDLLFVEMVDDYIGRPD